MIPILWTYYKAKDGLFPIRIRSTVTTAGVTRVSYKDTGIRVGKKQFTAGMVTNHTRALEFNDKIKLMLATPVDHKTFLETFKEFIDRPHGYHHKKKLNLVYRIVEKYNPKPNLDFLHRIERDLVKRGSHPNYIADIFKRVRAIVNQMVKNGDLEFHKNPFLHFKVKTIKTEKKRLTHEQFLILQDSKQDKLRGLARDMYVVSFYQGGIRFGDLCRLNKSSVQKGRLLYTMHKTSQERNLPLHQRAEVILKKYGYTFPLNVNWNEPERSIGSKNALMNKYLKAACRAAEIPEVSFHTSRHSIADYAVKKKLTSKQLQGILGHGRLSTTETYLKSFYREETDSGLKELFS